jgi:hypothetical protein
MMVSRRKFLSIAGVSALIAPTQITAAQNILPTLPLQLTPEIIALEAQLVALGGEYSGALHNELRHHYLAVDERKSRMHTDIILSRMVMDDYMLNTLCDWKIQSDPGMAVSILLTNTERYSEFVHLSAACLIKSGDLYAARGGHSEAHQLYGQVLRIEQFSLTPTETLRPYQMLARVRMTF